MKKRLTAAIVLASLMLTTNVFAEEITAAEQPAAASAAAETLPETEAEAEPAHTLKVTTKYRWFINRYRYIR